MSRTYKDNRRRRFGEYWKTDKEYIDGTPFCWGYFIELPTTKPKLRKEVDTEDHWMSTPSWWNNLFHTRPIRGKFRNFCELARKTRIEALEDMFEPEDSNSPHKYYW